MNLDATERAYLLYHLNSSRFLILESLPDGAHLTAGELGSSYAICDISHWTQADLEEFSGLDMGDQYAIIEQLELSVFANEMKGV